MKTSTERSGRRTLLGVLIALAVITGVIGISLSAVDAASAVVPQSGPKGQIVQGIYKGKSLRVQTMLFRVELNGTLSYMFCIDIDTAIEFGVSYTEKDWAEANVPNLNKVARVLAQTNATETGDPVEISAAQAAIWHFSDGFELDAKPGANDAAVVARYRALVEDAEANPVDEEPDATLEVTPQEAIASDGEPVFVEVNSTSDGPIAIEISDSAVTAHPTTGESCDTSTTIATTTAGSRICLTAGAPPRGEVNVTFRSHAATLSAGRVFVRPNRQKLIIGKEGAAQSHDTVTVSWTRSGRPTLTAVCAMGVSGSPSVFTAEATSADGGPLSWQWYVNGSPVQGSTSSRFEHSVAPGDEVSVSVTDSAGRTATTVVDCDEPPTPPVISLSCPDPVVAGATNVFTAHLRGPEGLGLDDVTFEWLLDGVPLEADGPTVELTVPAGSDLRVRAVDSRGNAGDWVVASCVPPAEEHPPVVVLTCPADVPPGGGRVTFTAEGSDRDGDQLVYTWWVNGTEVADQTGHTLTFDAKPGDVVAVEASDGVSTSTRVEVDCVPETPRRPPVVSLDCPSPLTFGQPTTFTAEASDPDGDALTFIWFLNGAEDPSQHGPTATFTPSRFDRIAVVAVDEHGNRSAEAWVDCVGNDRPTVTITCPTTLIWGESATFVANGSSDAADGADPLVYQWAIDGVPVDGVDGPKLVTALQADSVLTVTVTTVDGAVSASASANCVGNSRPTVSLTCPGNLVFGEPVEFTAVATDADGDDVVYEWSVDGEPIDGADGPTVTLTLENGSRVSVRVRDTGDAWSETATSTCAGRSTPKVTLECPSPVVWGEPVTLRATGTDDDGDTLTWRWYVDGDLVEGVDGPTFVIELERDTVVTVEAVDPTGLVSDTATLDCTGTSRPVVTLVCDGNVATGLARVVASVDGAGDDEPVAFTWAIDGVIVENQHGPTLTTKLAPGTVVSVTATAGGLASRTVGIDCSSGDPVDVPRVPSTPQVLANRVRAASTRALNQSLAHTGSDTAPLVAFGLAAVFVGAAILVGTRRRDRTA